MIRVAKITLPLTAILVLGIANQAVAGPQSLLDPYVSIKAPSTNKPQKPVKNKNKRVDIQPKNPSSALSAPLASDTATASTGGVRAGTKEIFHGIATATRGAAANIIHPTQKIGTGLASGSKKVGHGLVAGARNSKDLIAKETKAFGSGIKSAGKKMKSGTGAAGHALAAAPKEVESGFKTTGGKLVGGTETVGSKLKDGTESVGTKLAGMPKAFGKGLAGAASKTGEATKKVAKAPLELIDKLNPFNHKDITVRTASNPTVQQ